MVAVAASEALSPDELVLLGHYRRLKRDAHDFRIEVFGGFKAQVRTVEIRPAAYVRLAVPTMTEAVFEAVD